MSIALQNEGPRNTGREPDDDGVGRILQSGPSLVRNSQSLSVDTKCAPRARRCGAALEVTAC